MNKSEHIELIHHMIYITITNSSDKLQSCRATHVAIALNTKNASRRRDYNLGYYHEPVVQGWTTHISSWSPMIEVDDDGDEFPSARVLD